MVTKIPIMLLVSELGIGGCERDVTNIVINLDHDRFSPHVGCFAARGLRYPQIAGAGIPIAEFPVTSYRKPSILTHARNLRAYLKKHQIALVHSWDIPTELLAVPVSWLSGVPAIIKSQLWLSAYIPKAYGPLVRMNNHLAHKVLLNSEATRQDFLRWSGTPAESTYVSHNGVDSRVFNLDGRTIHPEVVVGTVCALREEKRLDILLRAFAAVREQRGGMRLLVVGSGPMETELKALRDQLGITDACEFVPSQTDVPPWMRKIDVFVICSQGESLPNALLESMASGCCVVASNVGGIPEVLLDGETGLLAPPADLEAFIRQIGRAVNDSELRLRLARAAVARASQEFSTAKAIGRIERLYTDLLVAKRVPQASAWQSPAL